MLLYHGGALFGIATDDPQSLGGPTSISKMFPIVKLNSKFLFEQIRLTIDAINQLSGEVKVVISNGSRNNQGFFRMFDTEPQQPLKLIYIRYMTLSIC